jgi:hypothetical protein
MEGNHGRLMTFDNDEVKAIGEGKFADLLLELLEVLSGKQESPEQQGKAQTSDSHGVDNSCYRG